MLRLEDRMTIESMILAMTGEMPGNRFYVDPTKGSDGGDGSRQAPFKTLSNGYAQLRSGYNDVCCMIPGATANVVTSKINWSKTYAHLIGLHPGWMNNRCRISTTTVSASMTPLFTAAGEGCIFKNFLISQEGSHATYNAVPLLVTGHRTYFGNVHTRNIGALAVLDNSHRALQIGSAYDISFEGCQFGETSYDAVTAAAATIEFSGTDSGKYLFRDCMILGAGSINAVFLLMAANIGGFTYFRDCLFHNSTISSLDAMTQAFSISGTGNDGVFLKECMISGATVLETADSGVLFGTPIPAAATGERITALTG